MDKSRIFIASSGRTRTLAEKLGDELQTEFCDAMLWDEAQRRQLGATVIESLERTVVEYDFAVIILASDDVMAQGADDRLRARDNCVFEAGLFIKALGRERCYLVNSVEQNQLPHDLTGIISLFFQEPADLENRDQCTAAIKFVAGFIKDAVQRVGRMRNRSLSKDELMKREKQKSGDLREDQVVVASIQPLELNYEEALQVKTNIDAGVSYVYFFRGDADGATKICKLLQMMLLAPMLDREKAGVFAMRESKMTEEPIQRKIVEGLKEICERDSLKIFLLPEAPSLQYCIHNATSVYYAKLYFKRGDVFIEWEEGPGAYNFWKGERQKLGIASPPPPGVFYGVSGFDMKESFDKSLKREMVKFFPGIHEQVTKLCFDGMFD